MQGGQERTIPLRTQFIQIYGTQMIRDEGGE